MDFKLRYKFYMYHGHTHTQFFNRRFLCIFLWKYPFELGRHKGRIVQEELITVIYIYI